MTNEIITNDDTYTALVSKYLNKFINDLSENREKVLKKLEEYPGKNHLLIEKAILEGPDKLPATDADVCKDVFNFVEFYSTGKISDNIEVEFVGKKDAKEESV